MMAVNMKSGVCIIEILPPEIILRSVSEEAVTNYKAGRHFMLKFHIYGHSKHDEDCILF